MTSLNDTYAGREILRMLYQKYGTLDPETLLSVLVMEHADVIFTRAETDVLTKRIAHMTAATARIALVGMTACASVDWIPVIRVDLPVRRL